MTVKEKYQACLLGGAIGDALGAPIEFMSLENILSTYTPVGVRDYVEHESGLGEFTDDTQMTLFTAEGILRAKHRMVCKGISGGQLPIMLKAYRRWLLTQEINSPNDQLPERIKNKLTGWLINEQSLYKRRAPGNTCISALRDGSARSIEQPLNDSKGCGTVMRVAPIGLFFHNNPEYAFQFASEVSALTHGHPTGYLSGGFLASVIAYLVQGDQLLDSIEKSIEIIKKLGNHEETLNAVKRCLTTFYDARNSGDFSFKTTATLGEAWVAEEALAISLFWSLIFENNFSEGVIHAINHGGDSDSTGAITGNILGVINGIDNIPKKWIYQLNNTSIVLQIADDLHQRYKGDSWNTDEEWWDRYPGF